MTHPNTSTSVSSAYEAHVAVHRILRWVTSGYCLCLLVDKVIIMESILNRNYFLSLDSFLIVPEFAVTWEVSPGCD